MRPELTENALAALRAALDSAMEIKPIRFDDEIDNIEREAKRLERWLGLQATVVPNRDKTMEAIREFARRRNIANSRQANFASFGCMEAFEEHLDGLIGDNELFPLLLRQVDDFRRSHRHFRDCYKGLLNTYLYYDEHHASPTGRENWRLLKGYLGERSAWIVGPGYQPPWVDAVQRNVALFSYDPGRIYGERIFRGETRDFDELQRDLAITDNSWLVWRIVIGRVEAALRGPDEAVRAAIPGLIQLLRDNPRARDVGLPSLLGRYRQFVDPILSAEIRDFAVETLGNPWLEMNGLRWSRVEPDAREMVANWLKAALIERFFNLLAQDGTNDTRRLNFWKAYHQSIHAMYFALGENARTRQDPDFRAIRKQMEGLRLTLTASPNKDNNAFIMCIGDHVVVEFGEYGNACYIFHKDRLPFELVGEVAGDRSQLKNERKVTSLRHTDRGMRWEERFRQTLSETLNVRPVRPTERASAVRREPASLDVVSGLPVPAAQLGRGAGDTAVLTSSGFHEAAKVYSPSPLPDFSLGAFKRFCQAHGLEWKDYRPIGGTLKVFTARRGDAVADQLAAWGFRFKKNFWWSSRPEDA